MTRSSRSRMWIECCATSDHGEASWSPTVVGKKWKAKLSTDVAKKKANGRVPQVNKNSPAASTGPYWAVGI